MCVFICYVPFNTTTTTFLASGRAVVCDSTRCAEPAGQYCPDLGAVRLRIQVRTIL